MRPHPTHIGTEHLAANYSLPKSIRVDQGPELISKDLDLWACMDGVVLDFSRPGTRTDNSFVEAFNGKVRAECIDQNGFLSLADARRKCEAYRHEYNTERPRSSIGNKSLVGLVKSIGATCHPMIWKSREGPRQRSSVRGQVHNQSARSRNDRTKDGVRSRYSASPGIAANFRRRPKAAAIAAPCGRFRIRVAGVQRLDPPKLCRDQDPPPCYRARSTIRTVESGDSLRESPPTTLGDQVP